VLSPLIYEVAMSADFVPVLLNVPGIVGMAKQLNWLAREQGEIWPLNP